MTIFSLTPYLENFGLLERDFGENGHLKIDSNV